MRLDSSRTGRGPCPAIGSPRPSCSSSGRSMIGEHPEPLRRGLSETRVRVDGFAK